jgi:putative hydrolase of the HAD superfamily
MIIRKAERFTQRPQCVLLDLDNTLYSYEPCHRAGMSEVAGLARELLNLPEADFLSHFSRARDQVKGRLGRVASSHSRLLYFQRTVELAGLGSQVGAALQLEQAYWRAFLEVSALNAEASDFLDDLRIARIPVVIVTDLTAQIQFRKMVFWGLDRLVDWIVTSEEAGSEKPAPASYQLAVQKASASENAVIWMIGDTPAELAGAKESVGAVGLLKCDAGAARTVSAEADAVFESFKDLRKCLSAIPA